jgi:flagellar biosynthesis/type III secretory pathway M-ring protein FliF/YscJ
MSSLTNQINGIFVVRQALLILLFVIFVGVAFSIILWAKQPDMRPLLDDMREAQAAKIVDVLEQQGIGYKIEMDHHKLYVVEEDNVAVRLALSRVGIVIEYPAYLGTVDTLKMSAEDMAKMPIHTRLWFKKVVRLFAAAIVVIVLIWLLIRPLVRVLIFPDDVSDEQDPS